MQSATCAGSRWLETGGSESGHGAKGWRHIYKHVQGGGGGKERQGERTSRATARPPGGPPKSRAEKIRTLSGEDGGGGVTSSTERAETSHARLCNSVRKIWLPRGRENTFRTKLAAEPGRPSQERRPGSRAVPPRSAEGESRRRRRRPQAGMAGREHLPGRGESARRGWPEAWRRWPWHARYGYGIPSPPAPAPTRRPGRPAAASPAG